MIDIRFAAVEMDALDELGTEALLVTHFVEERPIQGVIGLLDFRFCGLLARRTQEGFISGRAGEAVLLSGRPRLPVPKVLLWGLGPVATFEPELHGPSQTRLALQTLCRLGVRSAAMVLAGRSVGKASAERAMGTLLAELEQVAIDEVLVFEAPEAQRTMVQVMEQQRRVRWVREHA